MMTDTDAKTSSDVRLLALLSVLAAADRHLHASDGADVAAIDPDDPDHLGRCLIVAVRPDGWGASLEWHDKPQRRWHVVVSTPDGLGLLDGFTPHDPEVAAKLIAALIPKRTP